MSSGSERGRAGCEEDKSTDSVGVLCTLLVSPLDKPKRLSGSGGTIGRSSTGRLTRPMMEQGIGIGSIEAGCAPYCERPQKEGTSWTWGVDAVSLQAASSPIGSG